MGTRTASAFSAFAMALIFSLLYQIGGVLVNHAEIESKNSSARFGTCDLYRGEWVYDSSYPLYDSKDCPFIEKEFNCQPNGRPENEYLKYRWQPSSFQLPRFNGKSVLRRFRGKRVVFVGDSIARNQLQSLTCLIYKSVPGANYTLHRDDLGGRVSTFKLPAYDITIKYLRGMFLVGVVIESNKRVLKLDSVSDGGYWKTADLLVFDTWHWWLHTGRKQPWDELCNMVKQTIQDRKLPDDMKCFCQKHLECAF